MASEGLSGSHSKDLIILLVTVPRRGSTQASGFNLQMSCVIFVEKGLLDYLIMGAILHFYVEA